MRVLLVEDDPHKLNSVRNFLLTEVQAVNFVEAKSMKAAFAAIRKEQFDLVILDMSLPTFELNAKGGGGTPQSFGGREVLREMSRFCPKTPTIILTQYMTFGEGADMITLSALEANLRASHSNVLGAVHYNPAVDAWKLDVSNFLKKMS